MFYTNRNIPCKKLKSCNFQKKNRNPSIVSTKKSEKAMY